MIDPQELFLSEEQVREFAARKRDGDQKPKRKEKKYKWTSYDYQEQLELAKLTRIALLAVLAELHRLYFEAWDRRASIRFGSSGLRSLGFSHHEKIRALQALERAGWITVQWHKRKSPQVTILRGLGFKDLGL